MIVENSKGRFIIREAVIEDMHQLVSIHVTSWNATYPNYFPKPTKELREHQWRKAFAEKEDDWFCFVAQKEDGDIAGFATGNNFKDDELPYKSQLNKIHFLKEYQRIGLGRILVGQVVKTFLGKALHSMILFADAENPAIRFYEVLQGERLYDSAGKFHGAYGWKDLHILKKLCNIS